jgi:hypothetical protein
MALEQVGFVMAAAWADCWQLVQELTELPKAIAPA